jgi:5-formyltetrahydrofolate cyclo-ligase
MTIPEEIKQWRKVQRTELLAKRVGKTPAQRKEWDAAITRMLVEAFPLLQQMTVGFYWPFKSEFDPRFAIHHWRVRGARAALPLVVEKFAPLQFREWWPGAPMTTGVYDLPFPDGTAVVTPQALLIPPVGFDAHGFRLGYGGGYFDRTLATMIPQPLKIGVAYELSRMPTVRPQPHDVPMDFIVTEAGVHHVGAEGLALVDSSARAPELADAIVRERANEDRRN